MPKWLKRALTVLLLIAILFASYAYYQMRSRGFWRLPDYDHTPPELPELKRPAILVFSKTNSFIHKEAIPAAEEAFKGLANKNGWSVFITENGAVHNPEDLAKFDTIIWNNVTGKVLTEDQRAALAGYLESGGGWIGIHGAGDGSTEIDWPWYRENLIGAMFIGHPMKPQFQEANVRIELPDDPIMEHLGANWKRVDEWYSFDSSPRDSGMLILANLDETSYTPVFFDKDIRMGEDHPIVWKTCIGEGRAFYSAMGHTAESYSELLHITMLEQAIFWTSGLIGAPCTERKN